MKPDWIANKGAILLGILAAVIGLYCSIRSAYLAVLLERALPYSDQWVFISDYFAYLDGRYTWTSLLGQHNEHRPFTLRAVLFADSLFFNMNGWLPLLTQYLSLAAIAAIISKLATNDRIQFCIATLAGLGITWSISQYENLSWSYQVAFPFVHLFAVMALVAFAYSLTDRNRWPSLLVAACVFDFLAITSLASGMLIVIPALLVSIWLRRLDWRIVAFSVAHLIFVIWFFMAYTTADHVLPSVMVGLQLIVEFLGVPFRWYPERALGWFSLLMLAAACAAVSWSAIVQKRPIDRNSAILLGIAVFVLGEATMTSLARAHAGISARYCTASLVLLCALLGFYYRQCDQFNGVKAANWARSVISAIAVLTILGVNSPHWELTWKDKIVRLDRAAVSIKAGEFDKVEHGIILPGTKRELIERYLALKLGPYGG